MALACNAEQLLAPRASTARVSEPVTLVGAGDAHALLANRARETGDLIRSELDATPGARVFAAGDNAGAHGTREEYENYNRHWGSFKDVTDPILGNHELNQDPTADGYWDYFNGNHVLIGPAGERGRGWYAKTLGFWRIYWLNSERVRDQQATWLAADLPRWANYHKLAIWHKQMFSSPGGTIPLPNVFGNWWSILQQAKAELVVSGHNHRYERFPRMRRDGTAGADGIRQLLVGTGGGMLMPIEGEPHPQSRCQIVERGIVRLDLHSDRYTWKFIDIFGVIRDSGTQLCRALPG
jgi:acid phosphatase type 7